MRAFGATFAAPGQTLRQQRRFDVRLDDLQQAHQPINVLFVFIRQCHQQELVSGHAVHRFAHGDGGARELELLSDQLLQALDLLTRRMRAQNLAVSRDRRMA